MTKGTFITDARSDSFTYRIEMLMDDRWVPMPNEQVMESEAKAIFFAECFQRRNPNRIFAVIENGTDKMVYPIHY